MKSEKKQKTYEITPSWKQFFWGYVLSVLTIPIGIGLIALYFVRKKHQSIRYIIHDTNIRSVDVKYKHRVDLVDVQSIALHQTWLQEQLNIGTLVLETSASEMEMLGIEQPAQIKSVLEQAIKAEQERRKEQQKTKPREPEYEAGDIDRIEYLTGLWQQGLISEEDFEKERKSFD